jgi:hypothetical protein
MRERGGAGAHVPPREWEHDLLWNKGHRGIEQPLEWSAALGGGSLMKVLQHRRFGMSYEVQRQMLGRSPKLAISSETLMAQKKNPK